MKDVQFSKLALTSDKIDEVIGFFTAVSNQTRLVLDRDERDDYTVWMETLTYYPDHISSSEHTEIIQDLRDAVGKFYLVHRSVHGKGYDISCSDTETAYQVSVSQTQVNMLIRSVVLDELNDRDIIEDDLYQDLMSDLVER